MLHNGLKVNVVSISGNQIRVNRLYFRDQSNMVESKRMNKPKIIFVLSTVEVPSEP